jgi:hypothetical protein
MLGNVFDLALGRLSLQRVSFTKLAIAAALVMLSLSAVVPEAIAHGVADGDKKFIERNEGVQFIPFTYLGAKHMVTGYDHLLFLVGVIFFLYRLKDIGVYVTLFAVGHSVTLLIGVWESVPANPYLVDAIIGLSVVYKAFDNLGGFKRLLGFQPDTRAAVFIFGLCHGFGLATKMQEFKLSEEGLLVNILSFNVGVELGQVMALALILIVLGYWRTSPGFLRHAAATNVALMAAGFTLMGYQLTGYFDF